LSPSDWFTYRSSIRSSSFSTLRWSWPSASPIVVSLLTAPRPESELRGLAYGATEIRSEQEVAFYLRPAFWAVVAAVVFVVLNIMFW
jgi:SSS family solute:Na+ symporter